jgi:hypothetical protein
MDSSEIVPGSWEDRDISRFEDPPYPTFTEVMKAAVAEYYGPEDNITQISIGVLGTREVTVRVWRKEEEEPSGFTLTV